MKRRWRGRYALDADRIAGKGGNLLTYRTKNDIWWIMAELEGSHISGKIMRKTYKWADRHVTDFHVYDCGISYEWIWLPEYVCHACEQLVKMLSKRA